VRKARGAAEKEFMPTETSRGSIVEPPASESRASVPPSLSIILPSYNHGRWLPRSLRALIAQAGCSVEIVLIDDGSTDDSPAVVAAFCERFDVKRGPLGTIRTD
jgi:cellulose synthase/poly-beta-1,6-N-acetylglucosamine synthase-like glycosyltransferase